MTIDVTIHETLITVDLVKKKKDTYFHEKVTVSVTIQWSKNINRSLNKDNRHQDSEWIQLIIPLWNGVGWNTVKTKAEYKQHALNIYLWYHKLQFPGLFLFNGYNSIICVSLVVFIVLNLVSKCTFLILS